MADNLRGYTEQEVLNKVLNTSNDSIKVDIVAGAEYAEDAAHTSADTGQFILGVRNDTLAALGGTDGDYVAFQMNADGALYVDVANGGVLESAVDGLETTLTAIETDAAAIEVLLIAANADHAANEALLTTIDEDTNAIKGHVDGIETLITSTNSKIDTFDAVLDNILTKNTEIDTVLDTIKTDTEEIEGAVETIETAIKAEDAAHSSGDTGIMSLAVRNDDVTALSGTDGDYSPLQVNAAGSLYTKDETGEAGSIYVGDTATITSKIANTVFVAIQFIEDSVFDSDNSTGLVSASNQLYPSSQYQSTDIDDDGDVVDGVTFPQGMTIFGRWTGFKLASGKVIAYLGYV